MSGKSEEKAQRSVRRAERRAARRERRRARRWKRLRLLLATIVFLATAILITAALLSRPQGLAMPRIAVQQLSEALTRALPGGGSVELERARLRLGTDGRLVVAMSAVRLRDLNGRSVADLPVTRIALSRTGLLRGRVEPVRVRIDDVTLRAERGADGTFLVSFGQAAPLPRIATLAELVTLLDATFAKAPLSGIESLELAGVTLVLRDERAEREYRLENGNLRIDQTDTVLTAWLAVDLAEGLLLRPNGSRDPVTAPRSSTRALARIETVKGSSETSISASISGLPTRVIAAQSPSLNWLSALDVPISTALRGSLDSEGRLGPIAGTVELGAGTLTIQGTPIPLESAKAYITYAPGQRRIALERLDLSSSALSLSAEGHAQFVPPPEGRTEVWSRVLSQLQLTGVHLNLPDVLDGPVRLDRVALDMRLVPDAARLDIGQLVAVLGETRLRATGAITGVAGGLRGSIDGQVAEAGLADAMAFWPLSRVPKTRAFLAKTVSNAVIRNLNTTIKLEPGARPWIAMSAAFDSGQMRFLPDMPELDDGSGTFSLIDGRFALRLDEGRIGPGLGMDSISAAGTTVLIADTRQRPGRAEVDLRLDAPVTPLLDLLSRQPLNLRLPPLPMTGRATISAQIGFPTGRKVEPEEADWRAEGVLSQLASDQLVPGRRLSAKTLNISAEPTEFRLTGGVEIDGVPATISIVRPLGPGTPKGTRVNGRLALNAAALEGLRLRLPGVEVSGRASATFSLDLETDTPPKLKLKSSLEGLGLEYPALGYAKPAGATGDLSLTATLGSRVALSDLVVSGPGLELRGEVDLLAGGGLREARFSTLSVNGWLQAPVRIVGRGRQLPEIVVEGGSLDARGLTALQSVASGGGSGAGQRPPIRLELDRLILAQGLSIAPFAGTLAEGRVLDGRFQGRINGKAQISADLLMQGGRVLVRARSRDAGAALASVGVLKTARGGNLDMFLAPETNNPGVWAGEVRIRDIRIVDAPLLAGLLSALSIVGLLEQLDGQGLSFSEAQVDLRLSRTGIELRQGRAFGPSMGLTIEGLVSPAADRIDLQGVISPIYLVNALPGAIFARRGEGLFGFTYSLSGSLKAPSTQVNPLSILTPGIFRELFRRDPPELKTEQSN